MAEWGCLQANIRPAFLYGREAWCLKESAMEILRRTGIFVVRAMCGVQIKHGKRSYGLDVDVGFD